MMNEHTAKAFDVDLQELARMVAEMGGLAEKQIADSVDALARRDVELRQARGRRRRRDRRAAARDRGEGGPDHRPPPADGGRPARDRRRAARLPTISSASAISPRTSPSASPALTGDFHPQKLIRGVEHMAALVLGQLKQVLDAYAGRDLDKALAVWKGDEEIDAMCTSLFRELLTYMMEDPRNITFCIHLMFCAKNIERMGDHATNIAETVLLHDRRPSRSPTSGRRATPPLAALVGELHDRRNIGA